MNEETKKMIEELEKMVLYLHRSASQLDECVQSMKILAEMDFANKSYLSMVFKRHRLNRYERLHKTNLFKLEDREDAVWSKLIESVKEES